MALVGARCRSLASGASLLSCWSEVRILRGACLPFGTLLLDSAACALQHLPRRLPTRSAPTSFLSTKQRALGVPRAALTGRPYAQVAGEVYPTPPAWLSSRCIDSHHRGHAPRRWDGVGREPPARLRGGGEGQEGDPGVCPQVQPAVLRVSYRVARAERLRPVLQGQRLSARQRSRLPDLAE